MADVLNHPLLAARYFFPGGEPPSHRVDVEVDGATLACAHHPAPGPEFAREERAGEYPPGPEFAREERAGEYRGTPPTVVFFHGNGESAGAWQGLLDRAVNQLGWGLFLAEYRGYGGSTGEPLLGKMLDDVAAVVGAAGEPESLVVMGRSVGSIFALEAVRRFPSIGGLILESGIADAMERILLRVRPQEIGASREEFEAAEARLDHEAKMRGYAGPSLILHTRHDGIVDVRHGQLLHQWAGDSRLRIFESGDHNSIMWENSAEYWAEIADFLSRLTSG